jgi:hypothetical protein
MKMARRKNQDEPTIRMVSVPVLLDGLREQTSKFGPSAYVITVTDAGKAHVVSVLVDWTDDRLVFGAGRTTLANSAARPDVALLWAPIEPGGYSLIVDGTATRDDPGLDRLAVRPSKAILHRSAEPSATGAQVSDCVPVLKT